MRTCGDGIRGKEGGEGGLFRGLGGQMDKLCSVGGWLWGSAGSVCARACVRAQACAPVCNTSSGWAWEQCN